MPDFLVFGAAFAKALGSRVVLDLHDPTPEVFITVYGLAPDNWLVRLLRWCEKVSIRFADLVLTPNIAFRELFVDRGCPLGKVEILVNSPLEEVFPLTEPSEECPSSRRKPAEFVLMYHGTLVERHGLHTAVEAVAQLRERIPGLRFHIYGERTSYLKEQVLPLVAKLGLKDQVQYFGEQPQDVIAQAVSDCNLGVVPNLRTVFTEINFPTRIFEYLALGKPVVVPETRGIRDYFNMIFYMAGEVESLASQILWVFDHPEEARIIVEKGQQVYRRNLWADQERALISLLSGLLCQKINA
jgi:glycosyltransferase involved in cell wall biosynthesis